MERYSRHLVLDVIGDEGQRRLKEGYVVVIGLGGLGSVLSNALVRCGTGKILLVDGDEVELSNLQRQTVYREDDIGEEKAKVMKEYLSKVNSEVTIESKTAFVDDSSIKEIIEGADVVLDATDNMKTRYIINDACVKYNIPWIFTAILGTYGMTMNVIPGVGPCLKCLIPKEPDDEEMESGKTKGVLFTIPKIMSSIAATEAVKILVGSEPRKELLTIDLWKNEYDLTTVHRNKECTCCGNDPHNAP